MPRHLEIGTVLPTVPVCGTMGVHMDFSSLFTSCFFSSFFSTHLVLTFGTHQTSPYFSEGIVLCSAVYCCVLYCTVLYCTVLYCTVLYCTVLYCTILYCTVLHCSVLYCTDQYCTVLWTIDMGHYGLLFFTHGNQRWNCGSSDGLFSSFFSSTPQNFGYKYNISGQWWGWEGCEWGGHYCTVNCGFCADNVVLFIKLET